MFSISVDMIGANGGISGYSYGIGGYSGRVQCTLATTPGSILYMYVGGTGQNGTTSTTLHPGGFNGGGDGTYAGGSGGGGASDIRTALGNLSSRLVVAGGGGGGGYGCTGSSTTCLGGPGGGLTGGAGWMCNSQSYNGTGYYTGLGGTQTAGGAKGTASSCGQTDGSFGQGGNGDLTCYYGAAGGGGYYGGGGSYGGGGGGGSSYTDPSLASNVTHTQGYNTSAAAAYITVTANCTAPVGGAITGPSLVCGTGGTYLYTNPTGSSGGVWSSGNTSVATINPGTGILTAVGTGTSIITYSIVYTCGTQTPTFLVTVAPNPNPVSGTPATCVGQSVTIANSGAGTWSTGNTGLATITPGPGGTGGTITGLVASNPIITYTLPSGCFSYTTATIYPLPAPIQPASLTQTCYNVPVTFTDATTGGVWSSSNSSVASINSSGLLTPTGTAPVRTTNIIYTETTHGCQATKSFTVNLQPIPYSISFTSSASLTTDICSNGTGVNIQTLTEFGTKYQLYKSSVPFGSTFTGTGGNITWPGLTDSGVYTVIATNGVTGCSGPLAGRLRLNVHQKPTIYNVYFPGTGSICNTAGATIDLMISGTDAGVVYLPSYINGSTITAGTGYAASGSSPDDLGAQSNPGTYFVEAVDANGCRDTMNGRPVLTINPLPQIDTVIGGGSFCPGTAGPHILMKNSLPGISYDLYVTNSSGVKSFVTNMKGSSSSIDFGTDTVAGSYTVVATNAITTCTIQQYPSDPLTSTLVTVQRYTPPIVDTLLGGGNYCAGGAGVHLNMSSTQTGVSYQLWNSGSPVGTPVIGTGIAHEDLGAQFLGGNYTAIATDPVTHCSTNMAGVAIVNIDPLPAVETVNPGGSYCKGGAGVHITMTPSDPTIFYQLMYNGNPLGSALSGVGGTLDFSYDTGAGNYTVVATDPVTLCKNNMAGIATVAINTLPNHYTVIGGGNYCLGSMGNHVGLLYSGLGVNYQLYNNGSPVGSAIPGSNSSLDFGAKTATGTYTVMGTNTVTGCTDTMANSVVMTSSPPPTVYAVTASGSSYCAGDPGIDIQLSSSQVGVNYQFYKSGFPIGSAVAGTGLSLDMGLQTLPGSYTISAINTGTGCSSNMFGSAVVNINPLPTKYNVTGGGDYCAGTAGVNVGISHSDTWISYQLFVNSTPVGSPVMGTGGALNFGLQTTSGTYTVAASNPLTTCTTGMNGSVMVNPKPAPNAFTVTGGGNYCSGGTGLTIGLNGSDVGVSYQLYNGATAVGSAIAGTSSPLSFGTVTSAGTYTVVATTTASGCTAPMTGSAPVIINPLPTPFTVFGGGSFCAGSTGAHVMLSGSALGTNYQLYNGGSPVGGFVTATGTVLDFGAMGTTGTYTVKGIDAITGCTGNMVSSAVVTSNPLPAVFAVTPAGASHYCSGMPGVSVGLTGSIAGINYQLFRAGTPVVTKPGAGVAIDFGLQTAAGNYTVVATDATSGCSKSMSGSTDVVVDPVTPAGVTFSSGVGDTVCAGTAYTFTPAAVNGGSAPTYIWQVNGVNVGFSSIYSYTPTNGDVVSVTMTSSAVCAIPSKATSTVVLTVKPYQTPAASVTADPGVAVCKGTPVTFTATPSNEGYPTGRVYNWVLNSKIVDSAKTTYTYTPTDKDVLYFMLGSSYPCRLLDTVFSNPLKMEVDAAVAPSVSIIASGTTSGTTLAPGQLDTFTAVATNAGVSPKYQWTVNSTVLPGATNSRYISSHFFNNDSLSCEVTSSSACALTAFNSIIITVKNLGIGQASSSSDIRVLPNPNKGEFTVKGTLGSLSNDEVSLEVTNMVGQVVYRNKVMADNGKINERIKLNSGIANGTYMLSIHSAAGSNVYHIVIEQ